MAPMPTMATATGCRNPFAFISPEIRDLSDFRGSSDFRISSDFSFEPEASQGREEDGPGSCTAVWKNFCSSFLYSSTRMWALIPPNPKADTPARLVRRRGSPPRAVGCHGSGRVWTLRSPWCRGLFSVGFEKFREGGRVFRFMAARVLIMPAAPAAVRRWPILDLTDPREQASVFPPPRLSFMRSAMEVSSI